MTRHIIAIALALGLGTQVLASPKVDRSVEVEAARGEDGALALDELEQVDSIPALTRLHGFHAIDSDTLIVWRNAFEPYLIELRHPSPDLRFAWTVGLSEGAGRIYARFDAVHIDGLRYPIDRIYKLDRDQARELSRRS